MIVDQISRRVRLSGKRYGLQAADLADIVQQALWRYFEERNSLDSGMWERQHRWPIVGKSGISVEQAVQRADSIAKNTLRSWIRTEKRERVRRNRASVPESLGSLDGDFLRDIWKRAAKSAQHDENVDLVLELLRMKMNMSEYARLQKIPESRVRRKMQKGLGRIRQMLEGR